MAKVGVVIPAGGTGKRFGSSLPKQFLRLGNSSILQRTVSIFESLRSVQEIVVVAPPGYLRKTVGLFPRSVHQKVTAVVKGGKTRQKSVWNGLQALQSDPEIVLVHDAVRPLVARKYVQQIIRQAERYGAAVLGVRVKDTIKVAGRRGMYAETLDRRKLWAVQTPQGFRYALLVKAHRKAHRDGFVGTDEASLLERLKVPVRIVEGDYRNIKITTAEDLRVARVLQGRR
jgi:2-C-methyl-D-erythritol 4-phosphate cytidylyltransferase